MFSVALFLGYPVDRLLAQALETGNSQTAHFYIQNGDPNYLHDVIYEGQRYLGKCVREVTTLSDLVLVEANIYSLLKKINPHDYEKTPLVIFPFSESLLS